METPSSKPEWRFQIETSFVRASSLSIEARLLYIIIKSYAGPNCVNPYPSLGALSRAMNRHRASIQKYLKELEESGWIEKIKIKADGKFTSTRYVLNSSPSNVSNPSKLRSHDSSLGTPPTTGVLPSKTNQFKDLTSEERKSKESKESPPSGSVEFSSFSSKEEEHEATWKPTDRGSKADQLRRIRMPSSYPSEAEFDEFIEAQELLDIGCNRGNLYYELCLHKWHNWEADQGMNGRWRPIRNWKSYISALDEKISLAGR
jgi:hypothetical protein